MIKIYIDDAPYNRGIRVFVFSQGEDGRRKLLKWNDGFWFEEDDNPETIKHFSDCSLYLPESFGREFLKALVDCAASQGIRPDAASVLEGEMKATKIHLEDMRKLVFREPGVAPRPDGRDQGS